MRRFVRPIVLALVVSVAGLSSSVVICVTGCTDDATQLVRTDTTHPCHHPSQGQNQTIGNSQAACTHEPVALGPEVLSFDTRPTSVDLPLVASPLHAAPVAMIYTGHTSATHSPYLPQRPSAALRI